MSDAMMDAMRSGLRLPDPEKDSKLVEYAELSADLLGELHATRERLKALEAREEYLRGVVMRFAGKEKGAVQRGQWTLVLKPRKGSCAIDWELWAKETIGEKEVAEIVAIRDACKAGVATSRWIKVGKESLSVEIVKNEQEQPEV